MERQNKEEQDRKAKAAKARLQQTLENQRAKDDHKRELKEKEKTEKMRRVQEATAVQQHNPYATPMQGSTPTIHNWSVPPTFPMVRNKKYDDFDA